MLLKEVSGGIDLKNILIKSRRFGLSIIARIRVIIDFLTTMQLRKRFVLAGSIASSKASTHIDSRSVFLPEIRRVPGRKPTKNGSEG